MENNQNDHNDNIIRPNTNNTNSVVRPTEDSISSHNENRRVQGDLDLTPFDLPYEDPAVTNPEELASFPKPAEILSQEDLENENSTNLTNVKRSPLREGRNIISTDNNPNRDGFM